MVSTDVIQVFIMVLLLTISALVWWLTNYMYKMVKKLVAHHRQAIEEEPALSYSEVVLTMTANAARTDKVKLDINRSSNLTVNELDKYASERENSESSGNSAATVDVGSLTTGLAVPGGVADIRIDVFRGRDNFFTPSYYSFNKLD